MRRVSDQWHFKSREEAAEYEAYLQRRYPGPYDLRTFVDETTRGVILTAEHWNSCD